MNGGQRIKWIKGKLKISLNCFATSFVPKPLGEIMFGSPKRQGLKMTGGVKMIPAINLEDKIKQIDKPWSPIKVARVNDQVVRIALVKGEFHWHKHTGEDELFSVYKGNIVIQLKDLPDIALNEGEMAVIPKGVEHCPKSVEPSYLLLFEPYVLQSRGD